MTIYETQSGYNIPVSFNKELDHSKSTIHDKITDNKAPSFSASGLEPMSKGIKNKPRIIGGNAASFTVLSNSDAFLPCEAVGNPQPAITWMQFSSTGNIQWHKLTQETLRRVSVSSEGTLTINDVSVFDRGFYKCIASNPAGADTATVRLQVVAAPPNILEEKRQQLKASLGQNLWLPCTVHGSPQPTVHWVLQDGSVILLDKPTSNKRTTLFKNGTLSLRDVTPAHNGNYECIATSSTGSERRVVTLYVETHQSAPQIRIVSRTGKTIILNCSAHGSPKPEIVWTLPNGTRLNVGAYHGSHHHLNNDGTLVIYNSQKGDSGKYRCGAKNNLGYVENPPPRIFWTLPGGHTLTRPQVLGRYQLVENGTLVVKDTTLNDRGNYVCKAHNDAGEAVLTIPRIKNKEGTKKMVKGHKHVFLKI
uniref:Ig-like domain-containing protein n=1 Tax=Oryzias sinensis TaxID=183150 RepID=A0A8C7Y8G6_9TELE